jgi:hypothetical protein
MTCLYAMAQNLLFSLLMCSLKRLFNHGSVASRLLGEGANHVQSSHERSVYG